MRADSPAPLDARLYRAALHLCPFEFRREHGDEMACDFEEARGEGALISAAALRRIRVAMSVDLARTILVQWWRTGRPAIGAVALIVSLASTLGLASAVRTLTLRMTAFAVPSEGVALILLSAVALMVIVTTIVVNLCLVRPRRVRRR